MANLLATLHQNDSEKERIFKIDFAKEKVWTGITLQIAQYKRPLNSLASLDKEIITFNKENHPGLLAEKLIALWQKTSKAEEIKVTAKLNL